LLLQQAYPVFLHCGRSFGKRFMINGARQIILAPTGLGNLWVDRGLAVGFIRAIVRCVVGSWLRGPRTHYLFENRDDPRAFDLDPDGSEVTIVAGAGVDPAQFVMTDEPPAPPVKGAVVARMIWAKGITEAVKAVGRARAMGAPIELNIFGRPDPSNSGAIPEKVLAEWSNESGITWLGYVTDVPRIWQEHHIALFLSSYREDVPRTLVEAAASGRPIVTTDIIGCREAVRDGG